MCELSPLFVTQSNYILGYVERRSRRRKVNTGLVLLFIVDVLSTVLSFEKKTTNKVETEGPSSEVHGFHRLNE